jgi:hypothetical protein
MKLIAPSNRVIIKVDLESKNSHKFADGTTIKLARGYDNFNMRQVKPVNAIVVNARHIPEGSEVLIHHHATHDTYRLFNYLPPTTDASSDVKFYSVPEGDCYLWRENQQYEWKTLPNFITALRLFKPYLGTFQGIAPEKIMDRLYVTSGELKGKVVITLKACDYEIIYQNEDGKEDRVIRLRYYPEWHERNEVVGIDFELTEKVNNGEVLIGFSDSDAKKLD